MCKIAGEQSHVCSWLRNEEGCIHDWYDSGTLESCTCPCSAVVQAVRIRLFRQTEGIIWYTSTIPTHHFRLRSLRSRFLRFWQGDLKYTIIKFPVQLYHQCVLSPETDRADSLDSSQSATAGTLTTYVCSWKGTLWLYTFVPTFQGTLVCHNSWVLITSRSRVSVSWGDKKVQAWPSTLLCVWIPLGVRVRIFQFVQSTIRGRNFQIHAVNKQMASTWHHDAGQRS